MTMKMSVRVEGHNPVPLRPLAHILDQTKDEIVLYIGPTVYCEGSFAEELGWCVYNDEYFCFPDGFTVNEDMCDLDKTMARLLQPGERLIITYEG